MGGSPHSMLSIPVLTTVDYMKLDKYWLNFRKNKNHTALPQYLIQYARETGKVTVLEGIENKDNLNFAYQLGMDLVQGYLYREQFINYNPR